MKLTIFVSALAALFTCPSGWADPTAAVDALEGTFGVHQGARRTQAKGFCAAGHFVPDRKDKALQSMAFFRQASVPALLRFSVSGGNPQASDKSKSVRGMAVRLSPLNGPIWDQVTISTPMYFVKTAEDFVEFVKVRAPDPATGKPNPERIKAFNEAHPEALRQGEYLAKKLPPSSVGAVSYFGVNAFKMKQPKGPMRHVRWQYQPTAGELPLTESELQALPDHFLREELTRRLTAGPVEFDFWLQFAEEGDDVTDPTVVWPESRPRRRAGRLQVDKVLADAQCDGLMFNPLSLPQGIEPSADPVLLARPGAYAVSFGRRAAEAKR